MSTPVQSLMSDPQFSTLSPQGQRAAIRGVGGQDFAGISDGGVDQFISGMRTKTAPAIPLPPTSMGPGPAPSIWDRISDTQVPGTGVTLGEAGKRANEFAHIAGTEATALFGLPALAAAPITALGSAATGYLAGKGLKAGAKAVGMGDTGQELAENVGNLAGGAAVAPGLSEFEGARRIKVGRSDIAKGLGIPAPPEAADLAGRGKPEGVNATSDLDVAHKDLAQIERQSPVTQKGSAGTFIRAKNMLDYANTLWEEGHQAPISRNVNRPINPSSLTSAGTDVLTEGARDADPAGAKRAQTWLNNQVAKPRSLGSADEFLRELNADIAAPSAQQAYGNTFLRVKAAVAKGLRSEIESTLTDAGEKGVADVNKRYGAIRNLADSAIEQAIAEARTEGKTSAAGSFIPDFIRPYVFAHGNGMPSVGVSFHAPTPKGSAQLASGMRKLARTSLAPDAIPPPPPPPPPQTDFPTPGGVGPAATLPAKPPFIAPPPQTPVGTPPSLGFPSTPPVSSTPSFEPTPRSASMAENLWNTEPSKTRPAGQGGLPPNSAPPAGTVKSEFKRLGLSDLVTPRQQVNLDTLMSNGRATSRWAGMTRDEQLAAVRDILGRK